MVPQVKLDISGALQKFARLRAAGPAARSAALRVAMQGVMVALINHTPRDTHRMVRGFQMAANQAGLGPFVIDQVRGSRRHLKYLRDLEEQVNAARRKVARWEGWRDGYIRQGRTGQPYYQKILRQLDPNRRGTPGWALKRAEEELAKLRDADHAVVVENRGRSLKLTVRNTIYGGTGRAFETPTGSYITITNLEPHAIIQERRKRTVASLLRQSKKLGTMKMKKAFLKHLAEGGVRDVKVG